MSWKSNIQSKSRNVFIDQFKYNYSIYPDYKEEIILTCRTTFSFIIRSQKSTVPNDFESSRDLRELGLSPWGITKGITKRSPKWSRSLIISVLASIPRVIFSRVLWILEFSPRNLWIEPKYLLKVKNLKS